MSNPASAPRWLPPISFAVIALLIWLITFHDHLIPLAVTGQLALLLMLIRAYCYWPPVVRWVAAMPVAHRVVFGVLVGAMILGHYTIKGRTYFPFVSWEIFPFVNEEDPVTCRQFIATTADGAKVRLIVEQLFPSIVQVDPLDALDNPKLYPPGTTEQLVRALAKVYNQQHPDNPVESVDLMLMAVQLHPPAGQSRAEPSCELLKHYEISSDR
jgi:hypothetical protein